MSFLRRVARDVSRDIQVIINGATGGKPKRQRYDPAKAPKKGLRKFKGKFAKKGKRKFIPRAQFLARMKAKYGDKATTLNTETQRDPQRGKSVSYRQGYRAGREDALTPEGATDVLSAANAYREPVRNYIEFCEGYIQHMNLRHRAHERERIRRWVSKYGHDNRASGHGRPGMSPPFRLNRRGKFKGAPYLASRFVVGGKRLSRKSRVSRDFADELRNLSMQALGRLLNRAYRNGDDTKAHAIEREIDRRSKGAMLSRFSRRR